MPGSLLERGLPCSARRLVCGRRFNLRHLPPRLPRKAIVVHPGRARTCRCHRISCLSATATGGYLSNPSRSPCSHRAHDVEPVPVRRLMYPRKTLLSLALVGGLTGCGLSHSPAMIQNPEAALRARAVAPPSNPTLVRAPVLTSEPLVDDVGSAPVLLERRVGRTSHPEALSS